MKQWLDYIPLIIFFIAFKSKGLFPATALLLASSTAIYGILYLTGAVREIRNRQRQGLPLRVPRVLSRQQLVTFLLTLVFGGLTLYFHNATFLKWKATLIDWAFGLTLLGSHFFGRQVLLERMIGDAISLPTAIWKRLNIAWGVFFLTLGSISLFVAFTFSTEVWVNFKVFGSMGLTLTFAVLQTVYISRHLSSTPTNESKN